MSNKKVSAVFTLILEEIEIAINDLNREGASALSSGNYDKAQILMNRGVRISSFKTKVKDLQKEWNAIAIDSLPSRETDQKSKGVKLERGLRTHEKEYYVPILKALVEFGGSSDITSVIDRVGAIMKPVLNQYDYMTLVSYPDKPRWRNTAQWARAKMVKEGLLASDSPYGIWQITSKGEEWLTRQQGTL